MFPRVETLARKKRFIMKKSIFIIVALVAMMFVSVTATAAPTMTVVRTANVTIDYSVSFESMVIAGNFSGKNVDVNTDHFPLLGNGQQTVAVAVVNFSAPVSSDTAIAWMNEAGYRPASAAELVAFATLGFKEETIVALGQTWSTSTTKYVVLVGNRLNGTLLNTRWWDGEWSATKYFLAVRK